MRLHTANSSFFALSSLFLLSSSLPFVPRDALWVEPLVRRATYSVVAVDGGAAATSAGSSPETTIIETVVHSQPPTTKTVEGPESTHTVLITITPSPATVTTTGYSIVDVAPTVTTEIPEPVITGSSLTSATPSTAESSSTTEAQPSTTSPNTITSTFATSYSIPTYTSSESRTSSSSTPYISSFVLPTGTAPLSTGPATSASSTSYDNGQWHTSYPSWSNSTRTTAPSVAQASALPSLTPTRLQVLPDSVPGISP